jgi:NAD(P)H dehydrogenase (quinone)
MANILILYYSKSGNTKTMAAFVAEGATQISGVEIRLLSVSEATANDILWCDGIALGSPTLLGGMAAEMKEFWEDNIDLWQHIDGKIGCAFSSQGGWGGGAELTCQSLLTLLMNFGFLVFGVSDYVAHQFTLHYGAVIAGEPRLDREIASCRLLGQRLAEWVSCFVDGKKELHPLNGHYKRNPWD